MNFKSIYSSATTPEEIKEQQQAEATKQQADKNFASGLQGQEWAKWVAHPATQALLIAITKQIDELETTARNLALTTDKVEQIIKLLIVTETLRKLKEYVRTGN